MRALDERMGARHAPDPQVDHDHRRQHHPDRQDMDGLHQRNDPADLADRQAQRQALQPLHQVLHGNRPQPPMPFADKSTHSGVTLPSWMTLRHFGSSARMRAVSCSGVPTIDSKYCFSRNAFWNSRSANVRRTSALILPTTSAGMPGGPNSANQDTAS